MNLIKNEFYVNRYCPQDFVQLVRTRNETCFFISPRNTKRTSSMRYFFNTYKKACNRDIKTYLEIMVKESVIRCRHVELDKYLETI